MPRKAIIGITMAACISVLCAQAVLADEPAADTAKAGKPAKKISLTELAPGLTPVSDYTGKLPERSTLTGDWWGTRQDLYDHGVTFDLGLTQVGQWVASGGADQGAVRYNGLLDYGITLDTGKLDWWSGGLFAFNAQTSFGKPLKDEVGNVSPVNYTALWPQVFENDTVLMEYYWIQALPKNMVLTLGRVNPVNFLDKNRFANDPRNQFLNLSLGNDLFWGYFLSYSTYGVLLEAPVTKNVTVGGAYWTPNTQPGDYGGDFSDVGLAALVDGKWEFGKGLGGEANLVFAYSSKDTAAIDNPRFTPGLITGNLPTKSDNWFVAFDLEQYLWKPGKAAGAANPARTRSFDYQEPGLGLFLRFGYTPEDRNPWNVSISGGVSGRGIIPGRPYDRMGIGAYTLIESSDLRDQVIVGGLADSELGLEGFYNFAITPWIQLSADVQWISSGVAGNDNAWVVGTRLYTQF